MCTGLEASGEQGPSCPCHCCDEVERSSTVSGINKMSNKLHMLSEILSHFLFTTPCYYTRWLILPHFTNRENAARSGKELTELLD